MKNILNYILLLGVLIAIFWQITYLSFRRSCSRRHLLLSGNLLQSYLDLEVVCEAFLRCIMFLREKHSANCR